ncbi:Vesicle transport through interaction with t-SNAREs like 1A, partial [Dissostichus eleginoides]
HGLCPGPLQGGHMGGCHASASITIRGRSMQRLSAVTAALYHILSLMQIMFAGDCEGASLMACGLSITNTSQCGYNFDAEQVGQEILSNLHSDREKIQKARERKESMRFGERLWRDTERGVERRNDSERDVFWEKVGPIPQVPHLLPCTTCILGSHNLHRTNSGCQR